MVDLPNTAMIFPTSAALMDGLRGNVMNVGVKRVLIQRSDQPACPAHQSLITDATKARHVGLTETSITATARRVRLAPMTSSLIHRPAKSSSMQATDAGNDTETCLKRVSTPKQATRMTRMPVGTAIHDFSVFSFEFRSACEMSDQPRCDFGHGTKMKRDEGHTSFVAVSASAATSSRPAMSVAGRLNETAMIYSRGVQAEVWQPRMMQAHEGDHARPVTGLPDISGERSGSARSEPDGAGPPES